MSSNVLNVDPSQAEALNAAALLLSLCKTTGPAASFLTEAVAFLRSNPSLSDLELAVSSMRTITGTNHRANVESVLHNVLDRILDFSTLRDALKLGQTSAAYRLKVRNYIVRRLQSMLKPAFSDPRVLRVVMRDTKAVISGSWVLAFLLGMADENQWQAKDLDFYVPRGRSCETLKRHLVETEGYTLTNTYLITNNPGDYDFSKRSMYAIYKFHKSTEVNGTVVECDVDVIGSRSYTHGIDPIMYFDRTYVMNWITYDSIVCLYPSLTFDKAGIDQSHRNGHKIAARKAKYDARGFKTVRDTADLGPEVRCGAACRSLTRSTRDVGTMIIPLVEGEPEEQPDVNWKLVRDYLAVCKNKNCPRGVYQEFVLRRR